MSDKNIPLVVDVDGSLLKSNLLLETLWAALGKDFFATVWLVITSLSSRAKLKRKLSELAKLDISLQPVNSEVLSLCEAAADSGSRVILASGSDQQMIDALAMHLKIEGEHYGSDGVHNLTGKNKAAMLIDEFGEYGFDYIGNAAPDLKIWKHAHSRIVVGPTKNLMKKVNKLGRPVQVVGETWEVSALIKGIRPFQWIKNALLLVPVLAAHTTDLSAWLHVFLGIVSFSAGASTIYIVNDLLDLEADRLHPRKKFRPFAAANVPINIAMTASILLALLALALGTMISWGFVGVVSLYMMTSMAYSFRLKRMRWVDIFLLAWLYTLRVLAGIVAATVALSGWLLVLIFAAFLSLGAVKRMTELAKAKTDAQLPGRGYARSDMDDLFNISVMAAVISVGIFLAYTFSPTATALYSNLWVLRLASIPIAAWLLRMTLLGRRGQQDYDPVVFAARDKIGLALVLVTGVLVLLAA